MLTFQRFDPAPHGFPAPRVPLLPQLSLASLQFEAGKLHGTARWYRRGRYALKDAYRLAGVGPRGSLLAPAYHCRTMLDPAIALGADVVLYALHEDLSPDLAALEASMARAPTPPKALLLPHYFGFGQPLDRVAALCRGHNIVLIEDCSHALVGREAETPASASLGTTGDYGIASPYKFFAAADGGLLWGNGRALGHRTESRPTLREEARAAARLLLDALRGRRAPVLGEPCEGPAHVQAAAAGPPADDVFETASAPSRHYEVADEERRSLASSRWITRHTDLARLIHRRRANYLRWLQAVAGLRGCRPLFSRLPDDCVPYMFPLCIERPHVHFPVLKRQGLPIWRWDEIARSDCATAQSYRLRLLHLPCHQELSENDMLWMTAVVAEVCGHGTSGESGHVD